MYAIATPEESFQLPDLPGHKVWQDDAEVVLLPSQKGWHLDP